MPKLRLNVKDIVVDEEILPRTPTNREYVELLKEFYRVNPERFPPPTVFMDGNKSYLADGRYRLTVARELEQKQIVCDVRKGTREDAKWFACGANAIHGLRLAGREIRAAVELVLKSEKSKKMTNQEVANFVGCSIGSVVSVRGKINKERKESGDPVPANQKEVREFRTPSAKSGVKTITPSEKLGGKRPGAGRPSKAKKEFAKKKELADEVGNPIPERLRPVVADQLKIASIQTKISDLITEIEKISNADSGAGGKLDASYIITTLREARKLLGMGTLHAVCVDCAGKTDPTKSCSCKGTGWYTRQEYSELRLNAG